MSYTATIFTDTVPVTEGGLVHTWVTLTDNEGNPYTYSFSPATKDIFGGPGEIHPNENPERATSTKTLVISKDQFDSMKAEGDKLSSPENTPAYELAANNQGENCVTVTDTILEAGGVDMLSDVWRPGQVEDILNGGTGQDYWDKILDKNTDFAQYIGDKNFETTGDPLWSSIVVSLWTVPELKQEWKVLIVM
ncbi:MULTISPECIES: hypothetical protein [unclassified Marinobacter]|jgi:hypothetical protein|uniref:hypothetical protein n=1 Tax=unclassified Marinobacter TaxID=83889 RepID=UPI00200FA74C|nr:MULTISPECIES: hypothetical protein [unclassified Marinobacter]MCL1481093.1 hypothetical protein [Marinobacter sp.]UQG56053.1 hypothetical protein MIH16_22130 [Marinobacter sp. M4C]UQG64857.1 hypothetical protein MIH17_22125 [Marinobacter sp. M2C]UQG69136.1 hypothetical protein MIH19_22135 [Marinobacter sp. M1C]